MKLLQIDPSTTKDAKLTGALARDLAALRQRIEASLGAEDLTHLRKMERWGWLATAIGAATCWIAPNPLSIAAISLGRATRWMLMHHLGHRGYDKVPNVPRRYTSRVFARGWRRWIDWRDYMLPDAWIYEHNVLHHAHTGDAGDPDLIERNTEPLRAAWLPKPARYAIVFLLGLTWRATYYAPQTTAQWLGRRGEVDRSAVRRSLLLRSYLPFMLFSFVAPAVLAYLVLGTWAAMSVLINLIAADALTNLHTFFVVGPNHTGGDLYRFETPPDSRDEYYLRQIIGTVNYRTGGEINDYLHLFLNYQIEHHLFPDLPMRQYQLIQPEVRALCAKHGIPYIQESVWQRWRKMVRIIVGDDQMQRAPVGTEAEGVELGAA